MNAVKGVPIMWLLAAAATKREPCADPCEGCQGRPAEEDLDLDGFVQRLCGRCAGRLR